MIRKLALTTLLFLAANPAGADTYCGGVGPVSKILTYYDGSVLVYTSWRNDFFEICNLTTTWKGVAPATCFAWMSEIAGAISAGKNTGFWYAGSTACSAIPNYSAAIPPIYIEVSP